MVRPVGFEPTRAIAHTSLKRARLPVLRHDRLTGTAERIRTSNHRFLKTGPLPSWDTTAYEKQSGSDAAGWIRTSTSRAGLTRSIVARGLPRFRIAPHRFEVGATTGTRTLDLEFHRLLCAPLHHGHHRRGSAAGNRIPISRLTAGRSPVELPPRVIDSLRPAGRRKSCESRWSGRKELNFDLPVISRVL